MPAYFDYTHCKRGFTLVELLVVISIIAILSVIGITVFTGVQKGARDARRRGDIDAIAKTMEVHFGECAVGKYCNLDNTFFAGGSVPTDPVSQNKCAQAGNDFCGYCISSKNAQPGGDPNWANHGCGAIGVGSPSYWYNLVQPGSPGAVPGSSIQPSEYIVCANLETALNGKYYYCRSSQQ